MDEYRYLKLSEPVIGSWPADQQLQPGTIIRLPINDSVPSGPCVFNEQTKGWACANWLNTTDPISETGDNHG
ncbi:MAG: hypothetical protein ACYC6C_10280 [Coriobacteriia bacterium]